MKVIKRIAAAALAAAIMSVNFVPCAGAEQTYIYIRTAADMKDLADKCMIDSYSVDKIVMLDGDVDISGSGFEYIPYFSGTFDGGGYTISGINLEVSNPERGFIGTVGAEGIIKNLNVEGRLIEGSREKEKNTASESRVLKIIDNMSGDEKSSIDRYFDDTGVYSVGGITGVNKGTIANCSFSGGVCANKNAGGIAGVNEGRIEVCTNRAEVKGEENIGGIAGKNTGVIKWSNNYGRVNDNAVEGMYATGGVCGFSEGVIEASANYAEVGYKNTGSATGGIAGAQSGNVSECRNEGKVYGKKRVGGIVGNFEPYTNITYNADEIHDRIDEEKERIRDDLDELSDRLDRDRDKIKSDLDDFDNRIKDFLGINEITNSITDLNNTISRKIEGGNSLASIADTLAEAEADFSSNNDEVRALLTEARESAKRMSDSTSGLTSSLVESNSHITSLMDSINENMTDSERRQKLNETIDSVTAAIDSTGAAMDHLATLKIPSVGVDVDILDDTDKQLAKIIKRINDNTDGVLDPFISIGEAFNDAYNALAERKAKLEAIKAELEEWLKQLGSGLPTIKPLPTSLPVVTSAPDTAFIGSFITTAYAAEDDSDKTTLERLLDMDIHDIDVPLKRDICGENCEMAVIKYSINSGEITGISDVGGISGGVGFGASIGGSFGNIGSDGEKFSLNPSTAIKAVISTCINEGDVSAKNTSSGGISGFSDLGKVKDSINCGNIEVTEGSYAGGISGYSQSDIMRCINTGDIDAESDIGGIAGYGSNISQTYALTRTSSAGERKGAVAGTVSGELEHNYFLKEKLGGVNGVDYGDKAESVAKEVIAIDGGISPELSGLESRYWTGTSGDLYMPQLKAFTENAADTISDLLKAKSTACALFRFTVDFRVDGESINTINVNYGDILSAEDIPDIPKIDGRYGVWDKDVKEPIIRNTKFNAVYDKSKSTLSYGGEPPLILVEGDFNPDAELIVEEFEGSAVVNDSSYSAVAGYGIMIVRNNEKYDGDIKVHVRVADDRENIKIGLVTENAVVITDCERDGSYILFNPDGAERFIVLQPRKNTLPFIIIGVILLLGIALAIIFRKKIGKQKWTNKLKGLLKGIPVPNFVGRSISKIRTALSENETENAKETEDPEWKKKERKETETQSDR